ncbi:hypothetical protein Vi05172_g2440 [Venturia inaequalis]|nr:hypothetical protein Vi05172_g2440 [Venturia inaequalis]
MSIVKSAEQCCKAGGSKRYHEEGESEGNREEGENKKRG